MRCGDYIMANDSLRKVEYLGLALTLITVFLAFIFMIELANMQLLSKPTVCDINVVDLTNVKVVCKHE
jgi:hypothetical protein